jgi:hypothetical protein
MFIVRRRRTHFFFSSGLSADRLGGISVRVTEPVCVTELARRSRLAGSVLNFSEVDMSNQILIAAVSAILLASTGLASAQQGRTHWQAPNAYGYAPYGNSYYNKTYWDAVAPNMYVRPDPYVGTVWDNVAPY